MGCQGDCGRGRLEQIFPRRRRSDDELESVTESVSL